MKGTRTSVNASKEASVDASKETAAAVDASELASLGKLVMNSDRPRWASMICRSSRCVPAADATGRVAKGTVGRSSGLGPGVNWYRSTPTDIPFDGLDG